MLLRSVAIVSILLFGSLAVSAQAPVSTAPAAVMSDADRERFDTLRAAGFTALYNLDYVLAKHKFSELAAAFNVMRSALKDMTGQVREATENVNSASAEILASTQQQAAATKEQAATVQEITSTLEEINQSGTTVLFATHDHSLLAARSHRLLVLDEGRLTEARQGLDGWSSRIWASA